MSGAGVRYGDVLAREVLDRLQQLDLVAAGEGGRSAAEVARIRAELGRMVAAWRRLLVAHTPGEDGGGYCPRCRHWWRRRRWPCPGWLVAHARLLDHGPAPRRRSSAPAPAAAISVRDRARSTRGS